MGLFGGNEDKKQQKVEAMLEKYGLNCLSDPADIQAVKNISYDLVGNKMIELGVALQGNGADAAKLSYLNAIMQQNYIIIRQLDRLNQNIEKMEK